MRSSGVNFVFFFSNGSVAVFVYLLKKHEVMVTLNLSAQRRRDKVVILNTFNLESKSLTRRTISWADVAGAAKRAASALFSGKAIALAMGLGISAMWWHNITIADPAAAEVAVATDCLCALPWAIVWVCRETFSEKGGEA